MTKALELPRRDYRIVSHVGKVVINYNKLVKTRKVMIKANYNNSQGGDVIVSIIIPVYQVSAYIEACLLSVMSQTHKGRMECIIVNDATDDDSIEICERLIRQYSGPIEFRIINHETNRGLSAARNTGTDNAVGEYLYYLDSDDEITSDCIDKLMFFALEDRDIEMVQGNYIKIFEDHIETGKSIDMPLDCNTDVRMQFLTYRRMNEFVWNKLLKRSVIVDNGIYNKEGLICEDTLWTSHLIKHISKARLCEDVTYHYKVRSGSIVTGSGTRKRGLSYCVTYNEILNELTEGRECEELSGFVYNFSYQYAFCVGCTPEIETIMKLYKLKAKKYKCFNALLILSVTSALCRVVDLPPIYDKLNLVRLKFRRTHS